MGTHGQSPIDINEATHPAAPPFVPARQRVNEIDLLRFIAALAVLFYHYAFRGFAADARSSMPYPLLEPVAKYGHLGVELFFLISGFVILMTASRGSLKAFAVSRFVRLYPAFWTCCTLTFLAILAIGAPRYSATLPQFLVNMTMLSKFVGVPSIDGVYWSLFIELQFYAMVAVVVALGWIGRAPLILALWLVASIALEAFPIGPLRALLITAYSAYFIGGAACYLIWSHGISAGRLAIVAGSLALALYQSLDALPRFEQRFSTDMSAEVVAAIVIGCFAVMLLVATGRSGWFGRRRWLAAGVVTYPLYLLHPNIGYMVFNLAWPAVNAHLLFWGLTLIMIALAYAVHVFVERPLSPYLKARAEALWDAVAGRLGWLPRMADRYLTRKPAKIEPGTGPGYQGAD